MYTQCPECDVAFRVTAQVLKQAAGRVRCGGCGAAFNALAYLSEESPAAARTSKSSPVDSDSGLQESGELEAGPPPKTISAAQSAALLKTLDQLAGEDIRIEDTGVEWRVLDPEDDPYDDEFEPDPTPTITHEPMRFDDNTPLPEDFDAEAPPVAAPQPAVSVEPERSPDDSQIDLVFGEPAEWEDLLGAVEETPDLSGIEVVEETIEAPVEETAVIVAEAVVEEEEQPPDMDTQFAIQAEAMGIDLSGMHQQLEEPEAVEAILEDEPETSIEDDLLAAAFETEAGLEFAIEDVLEEEIAFDEPEIIEVPELSEEEMTINRMIDQDLLAIAVEDEDGFTSTIVQKQIAAKAENPREKVSKRPANDDTAHKPIRFEDALELTEPESEKESANPLMETIIMEGEFIHHDLDKSRLAAERRAASTIQLQARNDKDRRGRHEQGASRIGMISAATLLFVVLLAQVIHHSRAAFATSPTFQKTIAPIYRMVGSPVTPSWDIKGWRFEATKGSTDEESQVLTIYSRIGNTSAEALPYPLVHVSLTDRFEEIVGSRVLDPADYLVENADPRQTIPAGESFNAVFTIASPPLEATGFKLNVCYRQSDAQLRCAIEDFK
ncbi:MAG: zinc-ribbon and DUF3426 domain-containing protein [Gammaproteobacteria bacterium]|nr:zinc-ribbon and DUF3426 domain-containing protein [Gammaproteobacteria bacterium]